MNWKQVSSSFFYFVLVYCMCCSKYHFLSQSFTRSTSKCSKVPFSIKNTKYILTRRSKVFTYCRCFSDMSKQDHQSFTRHSLYMSKQVLDVSKDEFTHIKKVPDMFCRDSHMSQKGTDILRNIPDNVQEISWAFWWCPDMTQKCISLHLKLRIRHTFNRYRHIHLIEMSRHVKTCFGNVSHMSR